MQYMTRIVQNGGKEIGVSCVTKNLKWGGRWRWIHKAYHIQI